MNEHIQSVLDKYVPKHVQEIAFDFGVKIVVLEPGQRYEEASNFIAESFPFGGFPDVAGCYVKMDKTIYVKRMNDMTMVHEFGHAIDHALAEGATTHDGMPYYHSELDAGLKGEFFLSYDYVTAYASQNIDEYFAEGFRAYFEANSDDYPDHWHVTRDDLKRCAPRLYSFFVDRFGVHLKDAA